MNNIKDIVDKINEANSVLVVANPQKNQDVISASFGLFYLLKKIAKKVTIYPESIKTSFSILPHPLNNLYTYIIEIPTSESLKDLYYKKTPEYIRIFFNLKNNSLSFKEIKIISLHNEEENPNPDLIMTLGIQNLEDLGEYYNRNFRLFFDTSIINIDNKLSNLEFGQINWIEDQKSLSELIYDLASALNIDQGDDLLFDNLSFGIFSFYKNKRSNEKLLNLIQDNKINLKPLAKDYPEEFLTFFEKVVKIIKIEETKRIPIIILQRELFPYLNREKIIFLIKMLREKFFNFPSLLILWEKNPDLKLLEGIFYFPDSNFLKYLSQVFGGKTNEKALLFRIPKAKLKDLLSQINAY